MAFEELKNHGVTADTPKNIFLGAGTIHKGFAYTPPVYTLTSDTDVNSSKTYYTRTGDVGAYVYTPVASPVAGSLETYYEKSEGAWNFDTSLIGATSGGNKLSIVPEIYNVDIDGAWVKTKGMTVKTGETATMEINFAELTPDILKLALIAEDGTSDVTGMDLIAGKAAIETGDYIDDLAFVGKTLDGEPIIVIFDNALCTSGLELEGKSKEGSVMKLTFECYAATTDDLRTLPYRIYTPTPAVG